MEFIKQIKFMLTISVAVVTGAVLLVSCSTAPPLEEPIADDAGDISFVRQVVPILLGRKVRGYEELTALTDIITATDRETLIRALMEEDQFVSYWSEALVDHLRIAREGGKSQFGCYGAPLLAGPVTDTLADFVLNNVPSADFGTSFNMSDLLASIVKHDNLFTLYKAHLFPMVNRPASFFGDLAEQMRRADLATNFEHTYLNRQQLCLQCHNSETSASGEESGWDRTHAVPGHFEAAIYGSSSGTSPEQASAIFRTDVRFGSLNPWGINNSCGSFKPAVEKDPENFSAWFTRPLGRQVSVRNVSEILQFGYVELDSDGLTRSLPISEQQQCEFCSTSCDGVAVDEDAPLNAVNSAAVKTILVDNCATAGCHDVGGGGGDSFQIPIDDSWHTDLVNIEATTEPAGGNQIRVVPGTASDSYLINKLTGVDIGGSQMPLGGGPLAAGQISTIENWINDIPSGAACNVCDTLDCNPPYPVSIPGHEAAAFLLAERIVDNVWKQAMGYPLTIANYFPRNDSQLNILWHLTESVFIPSNWSLKELLVKILTSEYFNRSAPRFAAGTTPYHLPMIYDPWVDADPRVPPVSEAGYDPSSNPQVHNNAMSDGIHRYTAHNLLSSINSALDWPEPQRFPPATGYPDSNLERAIGQYLSDSSAGSTSTDFQALLHWESVHGVCDKNGVVGSDWIDDVMTQVAGFGGGGGPLTLEDLTVLLKDWLISDGTIATTVPDSLLQDEATVLADYFGSALNTDASTLANLEEKLRGLCGVMIQTPDFWLAGIAPTAIGPEPRLRVCNGVPCSYQEICNDLKPAIDNLISGTLTCNSDSATASLGLSRNQLICPNGICKFMPMATRKVEICLANPSKCLRTPPLCDPRCKSIECCGGTLPPLDKRGMMVSWADGANVTQAENIKVLRLGDHRFTTLEKGERVNQGDLLAITPEGKLQLDAELGRLQTEKRDQKRQRKPQLMLITGDRSIAPKRDIKQEKAQPLDEKALTARHAEMLRKQRQGPWRWGEAGRPLTNEQRRGYVGPEEEMTKQYIEEQLKLQEQGAQKQPLR
ncbi:MAG: hypothetical protein JAY90_07985 [Candidatus Thiodiazotropha lotti]|nr:hypothetical protein [Candidatus Thiodiazotropha lotti]